MKVTNKHHRELLREIKKQARQGTKHQAEREKSYIGTDKVCYSIRSSVKKQLVKNWIKNRHNFIFPEYLDLLNSLYRGESHNERLIAGKLLEFLPELRKQINPEFLDKWLNNAQGWAEVDSICQSNFSAEELLNNWQSWKRLINQFLIDSNVHKRRASLVLLTGAVRQSPDKRLSDLSFENIDKLNTEKDILITKAVSLLHSLILTRIC